MLELTLTAIPGSTIRECVEKGIQLARRLDIWIIIPFNGIDVHCFQGDTATDIVAAYHLAIERKEDTAFGSITNKEKT